MEELFLTHIAALEKILALFKADEKEAAKALEEEKKKLEEASLGGDELLSPAAYNALATIRTCPQQEKPTGQLVAAISDARDELEIIMAAAAK